MFDFVVFVLAF